MLYKYQREGIDFLKSQYHSLLADDMGLGKTVQAIKAAEELRAETILVICPASVKLNWRKEFHKWTSITDIFIVMTGKDTIPSASVVIINYDLLINPKIKDQIGKFDVCIIDEAHYLKSRLAKRTKVILGNDGIIRKCTYKFLLTGTPVLNRPIELYPILKTLHYESIKQYGSYVQFALRYCGAFSDKYGLWDKGATNLPELKKKLEGFMLRRTKDEVLTQLPEKIVSHIPIPPSAGILTEMKKFEDKGDSYIEEVELGKLASLRSKISKHKAKIVIDYVENTFNEVNKLIVFTYHREMAFKLKEKFEDLGVSMVIGGLNVTKKQKEVDAFVEGGNRLFIGQIQSAGVGIDGLQRVCSDVIFAEMSWTPSELRQAEDRVYRIGQKNKVHIQYLYVTKSIEEIVLKAVISKQKIISKILE